MNRPRSLHNILGVSPSSEGLHGVTSRLLTRCNSMRLNLNKSVSTLHYDLEDLEKEEPTHDNKLNVPPLPWYTILIVVGVGLGFLYVASQCNTSLPLALYTHNESSNHGRFIAGRALHHLNQLVSTKPRVSGSHENEVFAVDFLTREIDFIKQRALQTNKIVIDVQKSTGCAFLGVKYGFTNCYADITNIVVQLHTAETKTFRPSSKSLLLNCHFDSVPKSPGASAGSQCAVMLELLEVLSRTAEPLKRTVIFLFNGAKESYQQGALSFITKHPWGKNVLSVINLDAFGAGGREMLFQHGPVHPWLLEMYSQSVPHPHGMVLMDEAFNYFIGDSTDHSIFIDFGKISGLGFANFMNGYVYGTVYDLPSMIPAESLQHTGDNMLALIKHVLSSEEVVDTEDYTSGIPVYFDLFGSYMVTYSECSAIAINLATVCFAAITFTRQMNFLYIRYGDTALRKYFRTCIFGNIVCHITGILIDYFLARIAFIGNAPMRWYTNDWLIYPLYFGPIVICKMTFALFIDRSRSVVVPLLVGAQVALLSEHLLVMAMLVLATFSSVRSSYLLMLLLLFPSLAMYVMNLLNTYRSRKKWIVGYLIGLSLPLAVLVYHMVVFFAVLIPVYGRLMQPNTMPDVGIAVMSAIWCSLITSHLTTLVVLVKNGIRIWCGFIYLRIVLFVIIAFTPMLTPFALDPVMPTPQKINVYHTDRMFYNAQGGVRQSDSGYWVIPSDLNSANTLTSLIPNLKPLVELSNDCETRFYCGMPIFDPKHLDGIPWSFWVKAQPPVIHSPTSIELEQRKMMSLSVRRLTFSVKGPDHIVLLISAHEHSRLIKWSFSDIVPTPSDYDGNYVPALIVTYSRGMTAKIWNFWMDFQISEGNLTASTVNIAVAGHYVNSNQGNTEPFNQFLKKFPSWTHITSWTSTYKSWSF